MGLHHPLPSILDHPVPAAVDRHMGAEPKAHPRNPNAYFDAVFAQVQDAHAVHHEAQHEVLMNGVDFGSPEPNSEYPKHLHSKTVGGDFMSVNSKEQEDAMLSTGDWQADPLEIVSPNDKVLTGESDPQEPVADTAKKE